MIIILSTPDSRGELTRRSAEKGLDLSIEAPIHGTGGRIRPSLAGLDPCVP